MITHKNDNKSTDKESVFEQAANWFLELEECSDDGVLREHSRWLQKSESNRKAWQRIERTWDLLGEVESDRASWPEKKIVSLRQKMSKAALLFVPTAAVACLVIMLAPVLSLYLSADFMTKGGNIKQVSLADGSTVYLGASSALRVDFSQSQRHVYLLKGEAFFDVKPSKSRPFIVTTDEVDVSVLGTAFNVDAGQYYSRVGVEHGKVAVSNGESTKKLTRGQLLSINNESEEMQLETVAVDNVAGWRDGHIFVQNRSIKSLTETFQRYNSGFILIADSALANKTVTGRYQLNDVDSALEAMVSPYGGRVVTVTPFLKILVSR